MQRVSGSFHARFDAKEKSIVILFITTDRAASVALLSATGRSGKVDEVRQAADQLVGTHDFASFA